MYLEIRYFYFIWKSDKTVCSRRGQFPLRGKGKESLAQSPLSLRPPPETWRTPPVPHTPSWHKGAGLRSLPFGNPSQGDGGRGQGPSPLETPPGVGRGSGSEKRSRGCPLCSPTSAIPPDAGTHLGHLRIFSAAGRRLSFWQQSVPAAPSYG